MKKRIFAVLVVAVLVAFNAGRAAVRSPAGSQAVRKPQAPPSQEVRGGAAERQFRAWLEAFNGGSDAYRTFLRDRFPDRLARIDGDLVFRLMTGGFDLRDVEQSTPTRVTCLIQERAWGNPARAVMEVDQAAASHALNLQVSPIPWPPTLPAPARMPDSALAAALKAKMDAAAARDAFSGAVLVAHGGRVVFSGAVGMADRENKIPDTVATRFRMGSMNKMFTATAVMQLVQAGKVRLDAPVGKYLTDYPNKDVATKVTIEHLLTHTGGTGDIFGPAFESQRLELRDLVDYVKLYGSRPPAFDPGSRFEYSNYGFLLLGVVIERVSGQSYYDYVRDHIFKPAGMTSSGSEPENVEVAGRSKGYTRRRDAWVSNADTLPYRGTSAGGGYTTVEDLLRFATALTNHVLLDDKHTALLTTGKVEAGRGGKYAYGFFDTGEGNGRYVGHGGGAPGMNGDLRIYPASGYVVAALTNIDFGASQATSWIGDRLQMN